MAEPTPGTPVIDRRPQPRGALPRNVQAWLMAGLAAAILAIIVFSGRPVPADRPASAPAPPQAPSPDRLRDYQDRLRLLDERAREQVNEAALAQSTAPLSRGMGVTDARPSPTYDPQREQQQQLEEERKRLDYDSLFAPNLVASARQSVLANAQPRAARSPSRSSQGDSTLPAAPSFDDAAAAVLRASAAPTSPASAPNSNADAVPPKRPPAAKADEAVSQSRLFEGTVIDTVLLNRLDGSRASPVTCLVTTTVYAGDRETVLIPAGSRVIGETTPVQAQGEPRLSVTFHRLIRPDGTSFSLDKATGLNQRGDAGLAGEVNHHFARTFSLSGAIGLISGLAQWIGTRGAGIGESDRTVIVTNGADGGAQAATQIASQYLNRAPSVTIREGHRVKVYLTADLDLPAYQSDSEKP